MNVNIIIMSANNDIAVRNTEAQRDTFIKHLFARKRNHNYKVFFYSGDFSECSEHEISENVYNINCTAKDDIKHTYEKTCEAYDYIINHYPSDIIVRANISCYINIDLLDNIIQEIYDRKLVIANRINSILNMGEFANTLYPRGDFYIIRTDLVKEALQHKDGVFKEDSFAVDSTDDCKFGMLLRNLDKAHYANNFKCCKYAYVPFNDFSDVTNLTLNVRLKSLRKGMTYSGYSWNDTEVRKQDADKMHTLYNAYEKTNVDYYKEPIKLDEILKNDDMCSVECVQFIATNLTNMKMVQRQISQK